MEIKIKIMLNLMISTMTTIKRMMEMIQMAIKTIDLLKENNIQEKILLKKCLIF
jgi:hypothetical protein